MYNKKVAKKFFERDFLNLLGGEGMKTILITFLLIFVVCFNVFAQSDDFSIGKANGESSANGNFAWFLGGFGCGCFGIGFAYLHKPNVRYETLIGKSEAYVAGYIKGYQTKARNQNMMYASLGWLASVVLLSVLSSNANYSY